MAVALAGILGDVRSDFAGTTAEYYAEWNTPIMAV